MKPRLAAAAVGGQEAATKIDAKVRGMPSDPAFVEVYRF